MNANRKLIIGLLLLVVGGVLLFVTLHSRNRQQHLDSDGVTAPATVIKQFTSRDAKRANPDHLLRVSYKDETGMAFTLNERVDESFWKEHAEGSMVKVRYLRSDPNVARIVGGTGRTVDDRVQITIALVFMMAGVGLIVLSRKRRVVD
jgi:hypothetical protein